MKAMNGNSEVDAWTISHDVPTLEWVKENFAKHKFFWMEDMGGLFRAPSSSFLGGTGIYGSVGDVLIRDEKCNFTIVSSKKFYKHYKNIRED
ncbi:hypothetical protein ACFO26_01185 [Lactococcus nasutitermitis]|uniref:Uncharacterized protein n=1 Tax=Lactococcus nasutitermitis TaxID=1652957 RepID=A0ABV9JAM3_9LACT|nr:hypothetical protein [Lactococcus nasutitermitis]